MQHPLRACFMISLLFASLFVFFFNDTATTESYTLSLHDALPILSAFPGVKKNLAHVFSSSLEPDLRGPGADFEIGRAHV